MRQLEELTWPDLAGLDRARAVVFLPISPMEEHGPHLPVGTDFLIARALCERTAAELVRRRPDRPSVLAPPVPIGSGVVPMLGSLGVRRRAVHDVVLAAGRSLARDGFRTVVAVSGHMGLTHLIALESAARHVSRRFGIAMLAPSAAIGRSVIRDPAFARLFAALDPGVSDDDLAALATYHHGGMLETSVMLYLYPQLVRPIYSSLPPTRRTAYLGWRGRAPSQFQGYVGEPARARADIGAVVVAALAQAGADTIERALDARSTDAEPVPDDGETAEITPAAARRPGESRLVAMLGAVGLAGVVTLAARRWSARAGAREKR